MKAYQYKAIIIEDRGHLDDPELLAALNECGVPEGGVPCPFCGRAGHSRANGWKHREDQPKGANKQVVLLEREVEFECSSASREPGMASTTGSPPS